MSNYHLLCPHVSIHWSANYLSRNLAATLLANYSAPSLNTSFGALELNNMKYFSGSCCERRARRSVTKNKKLPGNPVSVKICKWLPEFNDPLPPTHSLPPPHHGSPVSSLQIFTLLFFWTPQMLFCRRSSFKPFGKRLCSKNGLVWSTLLPPITI